MTQPAHVRTHVSLTAADCALFAPRPGRARWSDLPGSEQAALRDLRDRMRVLVHAAVERIATRVRLVPWVSALNPNGAAPRDFAVCVHPASAPSKAFAVQFGLIVGVEGAELCLGVGPGTAQIRDPAELARGRRFLQAARDRLAELPVHAVEQLERSLGPAWSYRRRWKQRSGTRDFADLASWLEHAASDDGAGAAVSIDLAPDALSSLSGELVDRFVECASRFVPLFEHAYGPASLARVEHDSTVTDAVDETEVVASHDPARAVATLVTTVDASGYVFEPYLVASYVAALRTKPFVILAGATGTGKSRLPALVSEATGGESTLIPVRPDWTDSSEVLGYRDLHGVFRPGPLLRLVQRANVWPNTQFTCIVDEMNVARVEHYFAEVLSRIEERREDAHGGVHSGPLLGTALGDDPEGWGALELPCNLALVGTVNMDESAHGFSRKVLDRAFTLELTEVDLAHWDPRARIGPGVDAWPAGAWRPRALRLGTLGDLGDEERAAIERAIAALSEMNTVLAAAQLQVGYRTRDEVALFTLHARDLGADAFRTREGERVDPLDLALQMKVLPRIAGGIAPVRRVVLGLLGWAMERRVYGRDEEARRTMETWEAQGRPRSLRGARFPRTAAKLCTMWDRIGLEGFATFWT